MRTKLTLAVLATLASATADRTPKWRWRHCAVAPRVFHRLAKEAEGTGVHVHCKPGQVADSWVFRDRETLDRYMSGELAELDLAGMVQHGTCLPEGPK